nr:hypothetical chloroplast RF1 [Takakia lepidozioides]
MLSVLRAPIPSWISFSSPLILFGPYYGFPTTLPIGPSQILSIRAFLLEGNLSGTVAVSGSIMGQLIIFLSIYYSPLYIMLVKPHTITLPVLPYILFYWYRIKDLLDYQSLRPITPINDVRVHKIFLDSFIFQLFNPVLLPSPVSARLVNLFPFRHSNHFLFVISYFRGWLSGHLFFLNLVKLLLVRIERDSPVLYLLVKRVIYRTFSIIIPACRLLYLGRAPVPFFTKKLSDESQIDQWKADGSSWLNKPWPTLLFDYRRWNRPLRYIGNSRFSNKSPVKKQVSQYFFDVCLSDGKQRISFTSLPSLSTFEKDLRNYLYFNVSKKKKISNDFYKEWINTTEERKDNLYHELRDRIEALDNGFSIRDAIEKKTGSSNNEGNILTKVYDPFLNGQFRGKVTVSKSPWLLTERYFELKKNRKLLHLSRRDNKLKSWISNRWRELGRKNLPLPWEPLSKDARRISISLIQGSRNRKLETNLQQIVLSEEQILVDSNKRNTSTESFSRTDNTNFPGRKTTRTSHFNWELVLNLSVRQRTLYFNYLEKEKWQTLERSWKNSLSSNSIHLGNIFSLLTKTLQIHKKSQLQEIYKEIPRWTSKLRNDKFDVIAIGVTDIRQRKVKNLGYLIKGKDRRRKIVRRFSQQSDFRRKLVKGSMRARRRKILIWKILQLKTHSPFFLRIFEKHIPFQSSLGVIGVIDVKKTFKNSVELRKKIIPFSNQDASTTRRTKADRFAIANRWDFPLAQWGRSWLLIIQSHLRKYLILPILIISKNIIRLFLFQIPEWNEDWNEWNKEIHVKCTYDGIEVSERELPEQWLRDGLQIKIIYPFHLKPWHNSRFKTRKEKYIYSNYSNNKNKISNNLSNDEVDSSIIARNKKINYSYLTAWGFQTNLPFGNIKKKPSFWKPVSRELKRQWKRDILSKTTKIYKICSKIFFVGERSTIDNIDTESGTLTNLDTRTDEPRKDLVFRPGPNDRCRKEYKTNSEIIKKIPIEITSRSSEKISPKIRIEFEYRTPINVEKLENLKYLRNNQIERITKKFYFDKLKFNDSFKDRNGKYPNNEKELKWEKVLIGIQQIILRFRRKFVKSIQKWPYFIEVLSNKMNKFLKKSYVHFIRFGIELVIKIKREFFTIFRKGEILKKINIFRTEKKKNRIINQHSNILNEKIQNLKVNLNRQDIVLMSQAYVFHKIWQIETINKYDFQYLLNYWTSNTVIKKRFKDLLEKQGIISLKELKDLEENNWKEWLQTFNRYRISSEMWYRMAPRRRRNEVSHQWEREKKDYSYNFGKKSQSLVFYKQNKISYKVTVNPLLERTKKLNKRYRYNLFCYSYLDSQKESEMETFPESPGGREGTISSSRIQRIHKYRFINSEENNDNFNHSSNFDKEKKISFESDLVSWLVPELVKRRDLYKTEVIPVPNISLMRDRNKRNIRNKESLRERERHQTIRQWRWKSRNVEKKFDKLGDMASLTTFMQNKGNIVSLSAKMREDLDSFRLLFCRDIGINKLTINSEHRLSRVLDDQILMYKIVSTVLKFRNRFKRRLDFNISEESIPRMELLRNNEETNFDSFSLEDILLPRHRRELKILNYLYSGIILSRNAELYRNSFGKNKRNYQRPGETNRRLNENRNRIIKRFLWPSFRLEDLARINRFWFNTNNGSRFAMLRIRMYPQKSN